VQKRTEMNIAIRAFERLGVVCDELSQYRKEDAPEVGRNSINW
jgi:hypothetical protein